MKCLAPGPLAEEPVVTLSVILVLASLAFIKACSSFLVMRPLGIPIPMVICEDCYVVSSGGPCNCWLYVLF